MVLSMMVCGEVQRGHASYHTQLSMRDVHGHD